MTTKSIHIVPIDDTMNHQYAVDCPCEPQYFVTRTKQMALHNALDKREELEEMGFKTDKGWLTVTLKLS